MLKKDGVRLEVTMVFLNDNIDLVIFSPQKLTYEHTFLVG